jgi:hypothetical protein
VSRIPTDLRPNALAERRRALGSVPFDLTLSNPTRSGIPYPEDLLRGLSNPAGLVYEAQPFGLDVARRAVAEEATKRGSPVDPSRVVLTASTSESYSLLFKLLCDPGDRVLVPAPSYPLFEHLARLDGVHAVSYPLDPRAGWQPDLAPAALAAARAVIVVHPNNPTGTYVGAPAARELCRACAESGTALIADEVFLDYPLSGSAAPSFSAQTDTLVFTLGGLSKYLGLPQLKLGWIVVSGPARQVEPALERLAFIADSYLSVATPVQLALADLFSRGAAVRRALLERCRTNLATLRACGLESIPPEGGWSAVLADGCIDDEEELALELLGQDGVAVHPGYFFDFAESGYLAVSLLPEPRVFAEGLRRLSLRLA